MRDYKKIKAFQLADEMVISIYEITKGFPKEETYGLTSQIRRASVSAAANISEGASRQHKRDYLNFLYIAKASAAETEYLLSVAARLKYLNAADYQMVLNKVQETLKALTGLIYAVSQEVVSDSFTEPYEFKSRVSGLGSRV